MSPHAAIDRARTLTFLALLSLIGCYVPPVNAAEVHAVDPPQNSQQAAPTMTLLLGPSDPQVAIVMIPGGDGTLRFNYSTQRTRNETAAMLENLTRRGFSTLRTSVVVVDSPIAIGNRELRAGADHLDRIESVVRFYKKRLNAPIWLLGHSWGSVSVTEFINRSPESRALIAGIITSGGRYDIRLENGVSLPILFLHHERDGCRSTSFDIARVRFERFRSANKGVTELATVKGGSSRGDPCRDGHHMYLGALDEAARLVEQFVTRNQPAGNKQ